MADPDDDARAGPQALARLPLQTISDFARDVGLSASALRDYAERGLLAPADIEKRTGYRYYDPRQQQQAIWIRRLRDAGLGLDRIKAVIEGDAANAEVVLGGWTAEMRERLVAAEGLADDLTSSLRAAPGANPARRTSVRLDAAVLAAAITQVLPASSNDPDFDGFLLEAGAASVLIAATDRYVLLARTAVPARVDGPVARIRLAAAEIIDWLRPRSEVRLVIDVPAGRVPGRERVEVRLKDTEGAELALGPKPDVFPAAARLIGADAMTVRWLVFSRADVACVAAKSEDDVTLDIDAGVVRLGQDERAVVGRVVGAAASESLLVSSASLRIIAAAAVGEELTCELRGRDRPMLWRCPAQPDFAALVMPRPT